MRLSCCTARAIATPWRWPPESTPTGTRTEGMRTFSAASVSAAPLIMARRSAKMRRVAERPAEIHVRRDVEAFDQREVLEDDGDAVLARLGRAGERDRSAVDEHLAGIDRIDPGEHLDHRRLAGAVVADDDQHRAGIGLSETSSSATTWPKALETWRSSRIGSGACETTRRAATHDPAEPSARRRRGRGPRPAGSETDGSCFISMRWVPSPAIAAAAREGRAATASAYPPNGLLAFSAGQPL